MRDYGAFCEMFYASHFLPIALYGKGGFLCAAGFYEDGDPYPFAVPKLLEMRSPAVYVSSDTGYYGIVRCGDDEHFFVLGPAYSTPVTVDFVRSYMRKNTIPLNRQGEIEAFLRGIPQYTYNQFLELLLFLHLSLTGEKLDIAQEFETADSDFRQQIGHQHAQTAYQARDEQQNHGTYFFEQQMLDLIRNGKVAELNRFLLAAANAPQIREGKLAETPLRQAKNLFIGLVTMIGKYAAIPGGMDIEQTYRLIDIYIQECEKMQSEKAVKSLQYHMPIDFAKRVAQQQLPEGISNEVHACIEYISTHMNEPICVDDLALLTGKSRAFLFKRFREELGMSIGTYIMHVRLREAKSLLQYTDKSLGEISGYLCFSSQSHFQNVFKKETGMTPLEFRRKSGLSDFEQSLSAKIL